MGCRILGGKIKWDMKYLEQTSWDIEKDEFILVFVFVVNLVQSRELIGRFYHIFHSYSNKNLHFPRINIAQIHLK